MTDGWVVAWVAVIGLLLSIMTQIWRWIVRALDRAETRGIAKTKAEFEEAERQHQVESETKKSAILLNGFDQRLNTQTETLTGSIRETSASLETKIDNDQKEREKWQVDHEAQDQRRHEENKADIKDVALRVTSVEDTISKLK